MAEQWSGFSYIVTNLARFIRPDEITFSGVNSTMPMLACLLAKRAYDWDYVYINVAGGVDPRPSHVPLSSSDPVLAEHGVDLRQRGFLRSVHARHGPDLPGRGPDRWRGLRQQLLHRRLARAQGPPAGRRRRRGHAAHGAARLHRRTEHSTRTLVPRLDFVTSWGGFHGVVTPIAVFIKRDGRLALQSWHPQASLAEVRERTGFEFDASGAHRAAHAGRGARLARAGPEGQFERDAAVTLR